MSSNGTMFYILSTVNYRFAPTQLLIETLLDTGKRLKADRSAENRQCFSGRGHREFRVWIVPSKNCKFSNVGFDKALTPRAHFTQSHGHSGFIASRKSLDFDLMLNNP